MSGGDQFGSYRLVSLLGRGGMGETWRAVRTDPHGVSKEVALKRILPKVSSTARFVEQFVAEAKVTSQLSHGNIAQLLEFGQVDGEYFIALELVQGRSVASAIERAAERGLAGLPPAFCVYVACEALKGLHHAHTKKAADGTPLQIIHRDLSPDNLLLSWDGEVKLIDFGLAKARVEGRAETAVGVLKGKVLYFSPEQARAEPLTPAADVWALGVVLYFMLSGQLPIDRVTAGDALERLSAGESRSLRLVAPQLPASLIEAVDRARAARPADRYPSALAFQQALNPVLHQLAPDASQLLVSATLSGLFAPELQQLGRTAVVLPSIKAVLEQRSPGLVAPPGAPTVDLRSPRPTVAAKPSAFWSLKVLLPLALSLGLLAVAAGAGLRALMMPWDDDAPTRVTPKWVRPAAPVPAPDPVAVEPAPAPATAEPQPEPATKPAPVPTSPQRLQQLVGSVEVGVRGVTTNNDTDFDWHGCEVRLPNQTFFKFPPESAIDAHNNTRVLSLQFRADNRAIDPTMAGGKWAAVFCREGTGYLRYIR